MNTQASFDLEVVKGIVARRQTMPGAMLPILHEIQDSVGFVPAEAVPLIADALNLSHAEVHGVITYYHHFRQHPVAKNTLKICCAEACQAVGAEALVAHAEQVLGSDAYGNSKDGKFHLEPVYCLGQCACGPAMMVNDAEVYARITPSRFNELIKELKGTK